MVDEKQPIPAKEIVRNPDVIHTLVQQYVMLRDTSMMNTFKNTIAAINLLGDRGWEVVSMAVEGGTLYTLVRNTAYKRKFS